MKPVLLAALSVSAVLSASPAQGQGKLAAANAVCVVNMQRVVSESRMGKEALRSMEAEMKKSKQHVEDLRAEVVKLRADLDRQSLILSGAALESKGLELRGKERDLGLALAEMKQEFAQKNNASVAKVMQQTRLALDALNRERGCRFVFERGEGFVAYAAPRVELTDELIKELDRKNNK